MQNVSAILESPTNFSTVCMYVLQHIFFAACIVYRLVALCRWYNDMWILHISAFQDNLGIQDEHGSIFVNEAAFMSSSVNNRHLHLQHHPQHHHQTVHVHSGSIGYSDSPSAQNSLNSLLAQSNHRPSSARASDNSWTSLRSLTENPNNSE